MVPIKHGSSALMAADDERQVLVRFEKLVAVRDGPRPSGIGKSAFGGIGVGRLQSLAHGFDAFDDLLILDAADDVSLDSEVDYDDEQEEDQLPLDVAEAREAGVLLDDPEALGEDEDDLG